MVQWALFIRTSFAGNKDMHTAITHAGPAHADEFIALAILVAKQEIRRIERRNPTKEELQNPNIWVLDVGGNHDQNLKNFDHHGVEGTEGKCAFDLVLEFFDMREIAAAASPWLSFKSAIDCTGPYATATKFGMTPDAVFATISPIESQILGMFSKQTIIYESDFMFELLWLVGNGLLKYWGEFTDQLESAYRAGEIEIDGVVFCDYRACGKLMPAVMGKHMTDVAAAGSITIDDRDPGCEDRVVLYRHADHPRVDFRRLNASEMHFVHHNGFLAKTATGDKSLERIKELLSVAVE